MALNLQSFFVFTMLYLNQFFFFCTQEAHSLYKDFLITMQTENLICAVCWHDIQHPQQFYKNVDMFSTLQESEKKIKIAAAYFVVHISFCFVFEIYVQNKK